MGWFWKQVYRRITPAQADAIYAFLLLPAMPVIILIVALTVYSKKSRMELRIPWENFCGRRE